MAHSKLLKVSVLILASCMGSFAHAEDTIRVLGSTWTGFAPVLVAIDKGYFKDLGLNVEMKFEDDRTNVLAAYARGDIEVDMRTIGEHQGRPRDESTPGVIIGTIDKSVGGDGVISSGDISSAADLKGKTVAVEPNIAARLLLQIELKKVGLGLNDLDVKEIATADTVSVFSDSSIAAVGTYQPFLSQALTANPTRNGKILISSKDYPIVIDIITARQDDLAANPKKYQNFLKGVYQAIDFYKQDPAAFLALAAPHFNLSAQEIKASIDSSLSYTDLTEAKRLIGTKEQPGELFATFDEVMQLNLENGAAEAKLDSKKQIDPSVLTALGN